MRQNAMTLLKNALKNGICPLIPLPVPRAWESGTHRKSTDVQRGDEPGRCPVSLLLQSTSSASCYVWDDRPKRLSKMVKAFLPQPTTSPSPCPSPPGSGNTSAEVAQRALTQGGGAAGAWWEEKTWSRATMVTVTNYPAFLSFSGRTGTTTGLPHCDPTLLQQIRHS